MLSAPWPPTGDHANHHAVVPASEESARPGHDTFAAFRSSQLQLECTLRVATAQGDACMGVLLYSNTLRWLQQLQDSFGAASVPVRRGMLFGRGGALLPASRWAAAGNVSESEQRLRRYKPPPRKPSLGEHMREMRLQIVAPAVHVTFFNQYDRCGLMCWCGLLCWLGVQSSACPHLSAGAKASSQFWTT